MTSKNFLYGFFLSILYFTLSGQEVNAQTSQTDSVPKVLRVGVAGSEPFVFANADSEGIAVEIWNEVAGKKDWDFNYVSYPSVNKGLQAMKKGDIDLMVGPISITSQRAKHYIFSQPYYQSSLAIASRVEDAGLWGRIKPFFSMQLLIAVGIFVFILSIVGTLFWLAERRHSPEQFPKDPVKGIGNGMWLAIVTMSTTGYGDMAPVSLRGRIIAGIWMVVTIIFATSMVAGIASTLTLSGLGSSTVSNIEELSGKKTATVTGSPAVGFIKEHKSKPVMVDNLQEAMKLLDEKKVDAVIYDRPQLLYFQTNGLEEEIYIAKAEYYKQGYGVAFPLESKLVNEVNLGLLELAEKQEIVEIVDEYLGKDE
ncbi:transporter substrate-binding domain-containing protein [Mesonia ostreae]|uniref:Transporter substrate-binding domain-containing protein n=1 Tax=Mesonia ostreae TaxID=861110 RepID=A0ABU2KFC5_9FLAO|nr:transporter substrate-binding domain-containing protein [Mesonia ostreae]MDT0293420.1 transporter substrate-binding domain-containing protein [Mesonia ostreae]